MFYDEKYDYEIISDIDFETKYLLSKKDGSKYKKYILVYYKDGDVIKSDKLPNKDYLARYNNILSLYEVEEIISSCTQFDSSFEYKKYYQIKDKLCFIKYKYNEDCLFLDKNNNNQKVKEILERLINDR